MFQAEVMPVLVAAATWGRRLQDRQAIIFLDNEAARFALVKGYTPVLSAATLVGEAWLQFAVHGVAVWFCRVPTDSNPADAPSRLQVCASWCRVQPLLPEELGGARSWLAPK